MHDPRRISLRDARRIAARADVDPRTVLVWVRGGRQSPVIRAAIEHAAAAEGITVVPPSSPSPRVS